MAHLLEQKIGQVRSRARRLLTLYAVGWTVAAVLAAVIVLALADYTIRFADPGIRLMCSLAVLVVAGWCVLRFWLPIWRRGLGDVQIAQRVEEFFPALANRLASAVEFLHQPEVDVQAGSAALRRAVIVETTSAAEELDFAQVLERGPTRRALGAAAWVAAVALLFVLAAPDNVRLALVRLARPFGDDAWPRVYNLAFHATPHRLAVGQPFEVELASDAAHRVPDEVRIQYSYQPDPADGEIETELMPRINGVTVARKDSVSRPFWYRAEGGDDRSMGWQRLEVVEPPRLESLELTLHPPAYTGLPVETSEKRIHALRGTKVALSGSTTKQLKSATIHAPDGEELPALVAADGHHFTLPADAPQPLIVDKSGEYWIALEDLEGLTSGGEDRWEVRAVADAAPTVTIEQPAGNVFVTPRGEVRLKVTAKDDLALHSMSLHFSRSDDAKTPDFTLPLFAGPEQLAPLTGAGLLSTGKLGESRTVEHGWSLAELELKSGTQLNCWVTADDYLPQTGTSTVRRLSIISPEELEERLAQRQTLIFGELQRVLKLQQDARSQTQSLSVQVDKVGQLTKQDVDHAQAAELNQRQISRTLTSPSEGVPAQIAEFLADLQSNQVDSPDLQRRMTTISDELARLGQEHLGPIERDLTSVIKAAQSRLAPSSAPTPTADPLLKKSLAAAGANQDRVISSLEGMLDELKQWDNFRRFARDVAQLQRDQEAVAEATKQAAQKTLGRDVKDLDAQQQADLKKLAGNQAELSRRLEKTQQQMAQMSSALKQTDPLSAAAISDGLHQAQEEAISGKMRETSDRIEQNQLAQAAAQQAKIAKDLDELLNTLANRREQELSRLVDQLRAAEREMARIRARQGGLRKQLGELKNQPDAADREQRLQRLAREQKQLQEEAARLARRLERLQAEQAGRSANGAAGKMADASEAGEQGDAGGADEQAEQAEKDLEEAEQKLAERRRQAEADLASEQMAKLEDALKSLHSRQEKLIGETERLEKLRAAEGRFTRAQSATVHDLARQQAMVQTETSLLAEKLSVSEVIHLALDGAAMQMRRAAELLERQRTGSQTSAAQEAARVRFAQLLAALENKPKEGGKQGEEGDGAGSGGQQSGGRQDGNQVLTQLKLLKILQEDLNGRYRTLTEPDAGGDQDQLGEIATEQGRLAELALKLAKPPEANLEDDPEQLPDLRESKTATPRELPHERPADAPVVEPAEGADVPPPDDAFDRSTTEAKP